MVDECQTTASMTSTAGLRTDFGPHITQLLVCAHIPDGNRCVQLDSFRNTPSNSTQWVRDTGLKLALRPSVLMRMTASLSSKMYTPGWKRAAWDVGWNMADHIKSHVILRVKLRMTLAALTLKVSSNTGVCMMFPRRNPTIVVLVFLPFSNLHQAKPFPTRRGCEKLRFASCTASRKWERMCLEQPKFEILTFVSHVTLLSVVFCLIDVT